MANRARVLGVGGTLLGLIVIGLVVGFVLLGNDDNVPNANDTTPSPTPTDVRAQVEQAYLNYWEVYADAMKRLDPSRLDEVLTGDALENHVTQVNEHKASNQPVRISVEHDYRITISGEDSASVDDNYVNHSVRLDPDTMQPTGDDPNRRVRRTYTMKKVDGIWKVTLVVGFRDS